MNKVDIKKWIFIALNTQNLQTENNVVKAKHEIEGKIKKSRKNFDCRKGITIAKELLSACLTR